MYTLDIFNNPEPLSIYLARVDGTVLGCIDNIVDQKSASLHISLKKQYELDFDVYNIDGEQNYFEHLVEGMYLYIKDVGLFKTENPTIYNDGEKEKKTIKAYSVDSELEDKTINISVNTGKKESQEYLLTYDSGETENLVNPYTGIPYDWIVLYNTFPEQLVALNAKVRDGYFGTKDASGNIVVTDSAKITELKSIFDTIPRLLNKITFVDNQDGSQDSILTEYVIIEYDTTDTSDIVSYTLTSNFRDRISSLTSYYAKYRDQLSLLSLVLNQVGGGWGIGTICGVPFTTYSDDENYLSLCNKKFKFEINETVYSFFTQTFSKKSECVVTFDTAHRKVNITPVADIGEDTGIIIGYDTLVKSLNISTDEDKLTTRLFVTGGDDLSIRQANFGSNYIDLLAYKMNVRDSNGQRIYVSDNLAEKYLTYYDYRENLRENYVELAKQYEENLVSINDLNYRVPNDGLKTDYGTFTLDELKTALTHYKNLQVTLISLYKEDYGTAGLNQDGSVNENYIKTTEYWWDYEAYKNIIIEIECAIVVFPYYDDSTKWTPAQIAQYKDQIKAWETEWSLFGIRELEAKIATYEQNMNLMLAEQDSKSAVIKKNDGSDWNIKTWAELTDDEKSQYGNSSGLYRYSIYMDYYNNMVSAKTYLVTLQTELATLEAAQENIQSQMSNIVNQVDINTYFTSDEARIISRMFRDSDYNNDNIIVTSIDTTAEKLDKMIELIEDAKEQLSKYSRPQLIFSVEADNLFALNEFQPFWNSFKVGNYISVQYQDDSFTEVRLIGYTCNPCLPSANDLRVEFSNFIQSRTGYNDWADLLGTESGGGSRGSSSGSSSGSGLLDDIDETISNTMLSKLLNSEVFGTRVTNVILDTIDANTLTARMATFGGLADGSTLIDGKCIQTGYIIDENYAGYTHAGDIDNTSGTIINLETGEFNFGGGKLVYDGTDLTVSGTIIADVGQIGDFTLANGALYTGSKSTDGTNIQGVRLSANEINLSGGTAASTVKLGKGTIDIGGKLTYDSTNGLVLDGNLTATNGTITGVTLNGEDLNISAEREFTIHNDFTDKDELLVRRTNIETIDNLSSEFGTSKLQILKSLSIGNTEASSFLTMMTSGLLLPPVGVTIDTQLELGTSNIDGSSKISLWNGIMELEASSLSLSASSIQFTCSDTSSMTYTEDDCDGNVLSSAKITVKRIYGICFVSGGITLTGTVNDWVQILDNSAIPVPLHLETIYQTACRWASSYERGLRVRINSSGGLSIRYGGPYEYRFDFCYPDI